jgi:ankyrin repeat protein
MTPIMYACMNGHLDAVKCLQEKSDPSVKAKLDWNLLHMAAQFRQIDVIKYLLVEQKADVEGRTKDRCTAMHIACQQGHLGPML